MTEDHTEACEAATAEWHPRMTDDEGAAKLGITAVLTEGPAAFRAWMECPSEHHDTFRLYVRLTRTTVPERVTELLKAAGV